MCQIVTCLLPALVVKCLVPQLGALFWKAVGSLENLRVLGGGGGGSGLLGLVLEAL